jgi:hypothetical protein
MDKRREDARGYKPQFSGPMKLYLIKHPEHGEITVNGKNKYDAVTEAAHKWGVSWVSIARECEYIVLAEETEQRGGN